MAGYLNIILHSLNFKFLNLAITRRIHTIVNKKRCIDTEATPKQDFLYKMHKTFERRIDLQEEEKCITIKMKG